MIHQYCVISLSILFYDNNHLTSSKFSGLALWAVFSQAGLLLDSLMKFQSDRFSAGNGWFKMTSFIYVGTDCQLLHKSPADQPGLLQTHSTWVPKAARETQFQSTSAFQDYLQHIANTLLVKVKCMVISMSEQDIDTGRPD